MSTAEKIRYTPAEYLARERKAEYKSEYFRGEIFAMAGASQAHNLIASGISRLLGNHLIERRCQVYQSDMRLKVGASGLYTYPDVAVVCGKPEFDDSHTDTLANPVVLVEVLSPSTANYDRGVKFDHYQQIPSLKHYVLAEQDRPHVDVFTRESEHRWAYCSYNGLEVVAELPAIDCRLPLRDVYALVEFPEVTLREIDMRPR